MNKLFISSSCSSENNSDLDILNDTKYQIHSLSTFTFKLIWGREAIPCNVRFPFEPMKTFQAIFANISLGLLLWICRLPNPSNKATLSNHQLKLYWLWRMHRFGKISGQNHADDLGPTSSVRTDNNTRPYRGHTISDRILR